jgi:uncharacterized membrane protein YbhN (UPF0104 family)
MSKKSKQRLNLIIRWGGTFLSIGIMIYLLSRVGWGEAWQTIRQLTAWRILLVLVLVFISRLATFGRWHTLLKDQTPTLDIIDTLKLTFAGLFASNVLPTTIGGDVLRLAGAVRLGLSTSLAAASLVVDRLVGMTGMALMLPFSLPSLSAYLQSRNLSSPAGSMALPFFSRLMNGVRKVLENLRFWSKHPLILLKALGFTLIHQACIYLIILILIEGMGETLSVWQIGGIWSLTYFISLLPISINGLGLQEVTITNLYTLLGGLSPTASISLALILRLVWLVGSLPGAFFIGEVLAGKSPAEVEESLPEETL